MVSQRRAGRADGGWLRDPNGAQGGPVLGRHLSLVVFSHGVFGQWAGHADTATALAQAGFVAASLSHRDFGPGGVLKLVGRSEQISRLIDFALRDWRGHLNIDQTSVGAFGFSIGGFTTLVAVGGEPDLASILPHCRAAPTEWSCIYAARKRLDIADPLLTATNWISDPRIKVAVIAAPALGYVFGKRGLENVRVPIQLWRAGADQTLAEPWNAEAVANNLPQPPEYHVVAGADHGDFTAPCAPGPTEAAGKLCRDASGFDRARFHTEFNEAVVAFFKRWLGPKP